MSVAGWVIGCAVSLHLNNSGPTLAPDQFHTEKGLCALNHVQTEQIEGFGEHWV